MKTRDLIPAVLLNAAAIANIFSFGYSAIYGRDSTEFNADRYATVQPIRDLYSVINFIESPGREIGCRFRESYE